jgi:hypothetical protein
MQISAEIRYFWRSATPHGIEQWFCGPELQCFPEGWGESRIDEYLRSKNQAEVSIKRRGEKAGVEMKGLVAFSAMRLPAPFAGQVEIWAKWDVSSIELDRKSTVAIHKRRWLRKFDTSGIAPKEIPLDSGGKPLGSQRLPDDGCNAELTELRLTNADVWWTLGLEAFGTIWAVEKNLKMGSEALVEQSAPALRPEVIASYATWLSGRVL